MSTTDGLVDFLRARLDEDERAARKAASLCGCHPATPSWSFDDQEADGRIVIVGDPHPGVKRKLGRRWNGSYDGLFAAEHIVRHDPARVLREVEAKRRRLAMLVDAQGNAEAAARDGRSADAAMHIGKMSALLDVAQIDAQVHADHEDYREEWRP